MSIRTKQIGALANQVIAQFLQQGQFPTVHAVVAAVFAQLRGIPGTPLTSFTPFSFGERTAPATLTTLASNVAADIQLLYDEAIDQVNRIIRDFDYKGTRRARLAQRIVELEATLEGALAGAYVHRGAIGSFADVDFANTSAFLNFNTYSVELPPASNRTSKVDLTGAALSATVPAGASVVGVLENITNDLLNAVYLVRQASSASTASMQIVAMLPAPQSCSKIAIKGHVASQTSVQLQLDDETFTTQMLDVSKDVEWVFAPRGISRITITLSKSAPDVVSGGTNYFDFGLKSVSAYLEEYQPSAVFQTQPIDFGAPLGTLTLGVDQSIPANCSIAWAASIDGGAFMPLVPGQALTLATLQARDAKRAFPLLSVRDNIIVTTIESDQTGTLVDALPVTAPVRGGRTPLYTLCSISSDVEAGNTTVWRGRNAWKVRSYHYSIDPTASGGVPAVVARGQVIQDPPPSLADFISPRGTNAQVYTRFQPTEFDVAHQYAALDAASAQALRLPAIEMPINNQYDRVMHLFEATLVVDQSLAPATLAALRATVITLPFIFGNNKGTIYLNGVALKVYPVSSGNGLQYNCVLPLRPGTNLLQIVMNNYAALGGVSFDIGTEIFTTLCAYGGQIKWYADRGPMTEVSLFELQYQTARNDFSRYARAAGTNGLDQLLVVRELPTCVYDITTQAVPTDGSRTIALQATLTGSPLAPNLTPTIDSYTLSMEYTS